MRLALGRVNYSQLYGFYDDGATYKQRDILIPYHLLVLASVAKTAGAEVKIFDGEVGLLSEEDLADQILAWEPDFVGMTATTPDIEATIGVCRHIKGHDLRITTVIGGPHVTGIGDLDSLNVDYVVVGRGEKAIVHILEGDCLGRIVKTREDDPPDRPDYTMLDYSQYPFTDPRWGQVNAASVMSAQGCPFGCSFCFHDKILRLKDVDDFVGEIMWLYYAADVRYFFVYDETFLMNRNRTIEILDKLKSLKDVHFQCQTRANLVDHDVAKRLRDANFVRVTMGLESGSDEILRGVSKGVTRDDGTEACRILSEVGIETRASFILGLPYETHETVRETIDFAKDIDLYHASFNIMTPYPGTKVYGMACRGEGIQFTRESYRNDWSAYRRWGTSVVRTNELTAEELEDYQVAAQTEFYARDKILDYYTNLFEGGNRSRFSYRPINFAWRKKFGVDIPFWNQLGDGEIIEPQTKEPTK